MGILTKFFNNTVIIKPEFGFNDNVNRSFDINNDTLSTILTCEKILSESLAKMPLEVYKNDEVAGRIKDKQHPLYNILKKYPNNYTTSTTFFATLEKFRNHYGNAYAKINRDGAGAVVNLQVIHPTLVTGYKVMNGELFFLIEDKAVKNDDILHFKFTSDDGGIIGLNPIKALNSEVENIFQGKLTLNNAYRNNLNIDKYISSDTANFNTTNAKQSIDKMKEEYAGSVNNKKTPVLPAGFKILAAPTSSIQDAQILDSMNFAKQEIAALYGVPTFMLSMEGSSLSIEQMGLQFKTNTLMYITKMYRQELERKLLDINDEVHTIEFNTDSLVEIDYNTKVQGTIAQKNAGLLSPNDANRILGNKTFENGDYHYTQMQSSFPLEMVNEETLKQLLAKHTGSAANNDSKTSEDDEK